MTEGCADFYSSGVWNLNSLGVFRRVFSAEEEWGRTAELCIELKGSGRQVSDWMGAVSGLRSKVTALKRPMLHDVRWWSCSLSSSRCLWVMLHRCLAGNTPTPHLLTACRLLSLALHACFVPFVSCLGLCAGGGLLLCDAPAELHISGNLMLIAVAAGVTQFVVYMVEGVCMLGCFYWLTAERERRKKERWDGN